MSWFRARSSEAAAPEIGHVSSVARPARAAPAPAPAEPLPWLALSFPAPAPRGVATSPWGALAPVGALSLGLLYTHPLPLLCGPRGRTVVMGRGNASSVRLDLPSVSVSHCIISSFEGRFFLIDDSSNGTWVNNERVPRGLPVPLRGGDVLSLCGPSDHADRNALAFRFTGLDEHAASSEGAAAERAAAWVEAGGLPALNAPSGGVPAPQPRLSLPPHHRSSLPTLPPPPPPLSPLQPACCRCCACGCVAARPFASPRAFSPAFGRAPRSSRAPVIAANSAAHSGSTDEIEAAVKAVSMVDASMLDNAK